MFTGYDTPGAENSPEGEEIVKVGDGDGKLVTTHVTVIVVDWASGMVIDAGFLISRHFVPGFFMFMFLFMTPPWWACCPQVACLSTIDRAVRIVQADHPVLLSKLIDTPAPR
jgi:hypothetical protein